MHVRNDRILRLGVRHPNGLRAVIEQVHNRRAPKLKSFASNGGFEQNCAFTPLKFLQQDHNLEPVRELPPAKLIELRQVKEKKLLRETKVLLQQAIPLEAGIGVRQDGFLASEPDL